MSSTAGRFALNAATNWALNIVQALVGFIMIPYVIRHLGQEAYGIFTLVSSVLGFLMLFDVGLSATVFRFAARDQATGDLARLRRTASSAMAVLTGLGLLGALLMLACGPALERFFQIAPHHRTGYYAINACLALSFFLRFAAFTGAGILIGANRFDLNNLVDISGNLLRLGLLFALFETLPPSLLLLGLTFIVHQALRWAGTHYLARCRVIRAPLYDWSLVSRDALRRLAGFSAINGLNLLGWLLVTEGPKIVTGRMLGPAAVAAFAPALLVSTQIRTFVVSLCNPLIPLAGRDAVTNQGRNLGAWSIRVSRLAAVVSTALVLPCCLLAEPLLRLWVPELAWTAPVFIVTVASWMFTGIQAANWYLLLGGGSVTAWSVSEVVAAVAALALAVAAEWCWQGGLMGIALAVAVVILLRNVIYLPIVACRAFRISTPGWMWQVFARPLLPAAAVLLLWLLLLRYAPWAALDEFGGAALRTLLPGGAAEWIGAAMELLAAGGLITGLYLSGAWLGALPPEDRALLRRILWAALARVRGRAGEAAAADPRADAREPS